MVKFLTLEKNEREFPIKENSSSKEATSSGAYWQLKGFRTIDGQEKFI